MKKLYGLVLLLLLFHGCTSSGSTPPGPDTGYQILASDMCPNSKNISSVSESFFIPTWQILVVIALACSAIILAILFMINRLFGNEAGEAWVKIEIFELSTTLFIAIIIIGLMDTACITPVGTVLPAVHKDVAKFNLFDAAAYTLDGFSNKLIYASSVIHIIFIPLDFMTTTTMTAHPLGMGTVIQPTAGMGAVIKPGIVNALQMMAVAFVVIRAQLLVLDFSTFAFIKYYLPMGILLRSFAPTRRIGGTLIGLTVGLVLVFPSLIVLNGLVTHDPFSFLADDYVPIYKVLTSPAYKSIDLMTENFFSIQTFSPFTLFHVLRTLFGDVLGSIASRYMFLALRTAGVAFLIGIFFPALNTLLLVTTVRYLTKSFGEEIDISNLTRMI